MGALLKIEVLLAISLLQKHLPNRRARRRYMRDHFGRFLCCRSAG
jgi:hypothetical protein